MSERNQALRTASRGKVLDTLMEVTDYVGALQHVVSLVQKPRASLVAAANTHLVAEAAGNPEFAAVLRGFDLVLPDGMPLVWALRLDGYRIADRVYGPYFMEHVLKHAPTHLKHCFFGGTMECLEKLQQRVRALRPGACIADAISPPFGKWDEATEAGLIDRINRADADFVWVALGGVKQETWMAQNRHHFTRGVFVGAGDAFALIAGMRNYAPTWMQRAGLTWLHRLAKEPGRLLGRYVRYNSLFVAAFLAERLKRTWR